MTKQLTMMVGVALLAALALAGALGIFTFSAAQPVAAQAISTDVVRSFGEPEVADDGTVTVDVTIMVGGGILLAAVTETLPDGWDYGSASIPDDQIERTGQTISFRVIGRRPRYVHRYVRPIWLKAARSLERLSSQGSAVRPPLPRRSAAHHGNRGHGWYT